MWDKQKGIKQDAQAVQVGILHSVSGSILNSFNFVKMRIYIFLNPQSYCWRISNMKHSVQQ